MAHELSRVYARVHSQLCTLPERVREDLRLSLRPVCLCDTCTARNGAVAVKAFARHVWTPDRARAWYGLPPAAYALAFEEATDDVVPGRYGPYKPYRAGEALPVRAVRRA